MFTKRPTKRPVMNWMYIAAFLKVPVKDLVRENVFKYFFFLEIKKGNKQTKHEREDMVFALLK